MADTIESRIEAVREVVTSVAHEIDAKRWLELRSLYTDDVETDYRSLFGGEVQRQPGDALVDGWKKALAAVTTHHLLGPIVVSISRSTATAETHVRAMHYAAGAPGGEHWEVLGHYVFELALEDDAWMIRKMTLHTHLQTGNTKLLQEAGARR